ncbi:MAG: hypothetical protein KAJ19_24115 [Gammaproteobacteria bacterium]|nr:hypothetical protein [Gammaproteobacteria bacterium]
MKFTAHIIILLVVVLHAVFSQAENTGKHEAMDVKVSALRNGVSSPGELIATGFSNTRIIRTPGGMMELKELR